MIDYQNYVRRLEIERGFQHEGMLQKCLFLSEEVGELYGAVINSAEEAVGGELADIIIILFTIANRFDVNLDEQFGKNRLNGNSITILALQKNVRTEGIQEESIFSQCLVLGQEVGKLCKAVRKQNKVARVDNHSKFVPAKDILVKIVLLLCRIANQYDIDLERAFRNKEDINKKRIWR